MNISLFSQEDIFGYFLVFCRVGGVIALLPTFSSTYFPATIKIAVVMILTIVINPIISDNLPALSDSILQNTIFILYEMFWGFVLAIVNIILISAMHIAGNIVSMQGGLSLATFFDPSVGEQSMIFSRLFYIMALTFLVLSDFHYLIISGIVSSYDISSNISNMQGFIDIVKLFSEVFFIGCKLSMPVVISSLFFYFSSGILNRLMPNLQILFVMTPLQILITIYLIMITLSSMVLYYFNYYESIIQSSFVQTG